MNTKVLENGLLESRTRLLYPMMIIAAIAVILFSLVGIATMTGLIPSADANRDDQGGGRPQAQAQLQQQPAPPPAAQPCSNCGVIESVRAIETAGHASGLGAIAGGVAGGLLGNQIGHGNGRTVTTVLGAAGGAYAGHTIEGNMNKSVRWQVRVRMDDGSRRTLYEAAQPGVAVGQKVRLENGAVVSRG